MNRRRIAMWVWGGGLVGLLSFAGAGTAPAEEPTEPGVEVTVYNQNLALVKDRRNLSIPADGVLRFRNVPTTIDATSVLFRTLGGGEAGHVLEQNYEFDLVSAQKLLDRYVDERVELVTMDGEVHSGTLLSFDPATVVLQGTDGLEMVTRNENVRTIRLPSLPDGLLTRPTLVWQVGGARGDRLAEVSYLCGGLSWQADYVAVLNDAETAIDLSAWVTLTNRSGATYEDARLKLIAGDVARVRDPEQRLLREEMEHLGRQSEGFEQQAFFEYHLYTLGRPTTLRNNQVKQVALFDPVSEVPVEKRYYYSAGMGEKVQVRIYLENTEEARMGMPLPMGRVRLSKADSEGSLQFVGEDRIDHTPRDEDMELVLGNAFDLVGERVVVQQRQITQRVREATIEYRLRNHKEDETVTIRVLEGLGSNWEILDFPADLTWERKDGRADTIEIPVEVAPGRDGRTFRFRVRWSH